MDLAIFRNELESAGPSVVQKLYEWAQKKADKKFLYYGEEDRYLSYGDFNAITNNIGNFLKSMGIAKGDKISVYLYNPLITALAMFGIWKAGAVYAPINFSYKGRLLSYQINDTEPRMFITEQSRVPFLNDAKADLPAVKVLLRTPRRDEHDYKSDVANVELDQKFERFDFDNLLEGNSFNLDTKINYWDVANIIYTSGTTGSAKGVIQSHRWISQYVYAMRRITHEDDICYSDLPMYHIGGAFGYLGRVVWAGSNIAIWDRFSPKGFWKRIEKSGSNTTALLDIMMPWLMNAEETAKDRCNSLFRVHMQPLPYNHNKIARRFGFDLVTTAYGSTETGNPIVSIINELAEGEGTPKELLKGYSKEYIFKKFLECGYPVFSGTDEIKKGMLGRSYHYEPAILNERDEILGAGMSGQLAFRSKLAHGLPDGYFNKPEATVKVNRNQWFHTGDACYKDENEIYYYVDRMGSFIRVRGENISSFQIEDIINSHPSVNIATALGIPAQEGDEDDLVVYITLKEPMRLEEDELRKWLASEMPKFMWPKYIRFINDNELPRTSTNKIVKYKLQEKILAELKETK